MKLLDVVNAPWAILPDKLMEIREIYMTHLRGEKIDLAAVEARLGQPLLNERKEDYEVIDGVAILPLQGVIAQRANLFMRVSGGTSSQLFARDMKTAAGDPNVKAILIDADSPGGAVNGVETAAAAVRQAAEMKPVVAFTDGQLASGAYWISAAADRIVISGKTTVLGSIGVVTAHNDISRAQEAAGIKTTEITAGRYKRIATQYAPLSEEGRAYLQEQVDDLYTAFVDSIAELRDVPVEKVLADMADGRIFIGTKAIDAGLADGVSSLDALVADLAAGRYSRRRTQSRSAGVALAPQTSTTTTGVVMDITKEKIAAEHPAIAEAFRVEGAAAERKRIQDVEAAGRIPGHEALISSLKFDGKTTGGEAALQVVAAEGAMLDNKRKALDNDAPAPVPGTASATGDRAAPTKPAEDPKLSVDDRCKAKWESDATVRAEFTSLQDYTAFEKAQASGKVRVLGGK